MYEEKIKKTIISGCYGDVLLYKDYFKNEEIKIENQWSYIVEMLIITIKSLIPSYEEIRNEIDYERFYREINFWKLYRHGGNSLLTNIENSDVSYWQKSDNSIYSRIYPIIISNSNYNYIREDIIKNILFTTGSIKNLLEGIFLSRLIFVLLNFNMNFDEIVDEIKNEIINISIINILEKYSNFYKVDKSTFPGNYILEFERNRIKLLNLLNEIKTDEFRLLNDILDILRNNKKFEQVKPNFLTYSIIGMNIDSIENIEVKDKDFLLNLCDYLIKLRKGRISPELLKINEYILPDVFKYNINDEFNHSLLNKCKVIFKVENKRLSKSYIETKGGIYRFQKIKDY